jgi:hypothetical protein
MDIRLNGIHESALLKLAELNDQKTASGMVKLLIRDAAKEARVWPICRVEQQEPVEEPVR